MLLDRAKIYEVKQRADRCVNRIVHLAPFLIHEPQSLYECRRAFRVLLEKHRRFDAARITLQDRGTVLQIRHDEIADLQVIAEQIELCEFLIRPISSIQAG